MSEANFQYWIDVTARRYLPHGRTPYYFARGKLGGDPVFAHIFREGLIASGARVVDLGCGQGVLPSLLASIDTAEAAQRWPLGWALPPRNVQCRGVDLRSDAIATARAALGDKVQLEPGDIRTYAIPSCDVVTIFDVLHYIDYNEQRQVIERAHDALAPGGKLLLRVGDAAADWRFALTLAGDWLITLIRGHWQKKFYCRSIDEWKTLLSDIGFEVSSLPMSAGTPFANVLLMAQRR